MPVFPKYVSVRLRTSQSAQLDFWRGAIGEAELTGFPFGLIEEPWGAEVNPERCVAVVADVRTEQEMHELQQLPVTAVCSNHLVDAIPGVVSIRPCDLTCGEMAARHLVQRGYRSFATLSEGSTHTECRVKGFWRTIHHEMPAAPEVRITIPSEELWALDNPFKDIEFLWQHVEEQLAACPPDTGFFCATGCLGERFLYAAHCNVGERVNVMGVVGVNDREQRFFIPGSAISLTKVDMGREHLGAEIVKWLSARIDADSISSHKGDVVLVPPTGIMIRSSSAGYACAHPLAARAGRMIWEHVQYGEVPSVDAIAEEFRMSSRTLRRIFQEYHGSNFRDFVRRVQHDRAKHLLRDPALTIAEVAVGCGFHSQSAFARAFAVKEGVSPRQWRRQ